MPATSKYPFRAESHCVMVSLRAAPWQSIQACWSTAPLRTTSQSGNPHPDWTESPGCHGNRPICHIPAIWCLSKDPSVRGGPDKVNNPVCARHALRFALMQQYICWTSQTEPSQLSNITSVSTQNSLFHVLYLLSILPILLSLPQHLSHEETDSKAGNCSDQGNCPGPVRAVVSFALDSSFFFLKPPHDCLFPAELWWIRLQLQPILLPGPRRLLLLFWGLETASLLGPHTLYCTAR